MMTRRNHVIGLFVCVMAFYAAGADAATIQLDLPEYWLNLNDTNSVTVTVVYEITDALIEASNVGFRLESSPGMGVPGELTTSIDDISQSLLTPYIFEPNAGFFDTGSGGVVATGGDNTDDGLVDVLTTGEYYLASVTWTVSGVPNDGVAYDFFLDFTSLGIVTVLTDPVDNDFLTSAEGAVVHVVPEPISLLILGIGGIFCARRRCARYRLRSSVHQQ